VDTRFLMNEDQIFKIKIKFAFCPAVSSESFDLRLHILSIQIKVEAKSMLHFLVA